MKIQRIEVGFKNGIKDALGEKIKKQIVEDLNLPVLKVKTVDVYTIEADLAKKELNFLGENLFIDPIIQEFSLPPHLIRCGGLAKDFDWSIEVGFKPGVTDNVGRTAKEAIEELLKRKIEGEIFTSKKYLFYGNLKREDLEKVAKKILANELIQRWQILKKGEEEKRLPIPKVKIPHRPEIKLFNLNIADEDLLKISGERKLALNLEEMKAIKNYFLNPKVMKERKKIGLSENPTDAELEAIAQTWSEHCKHKIFNAKIKYKERGKETEINGLFETFIKGSTLKLKKKLKWLVSVFWDNSGVMKFNQDWLFCFKCETHNSPSNEEPYGGALTGIVGVYRDIMGTGRGGRLIYGTYGFCAGNPFYNGELRPKFHPKRLLEGVRSGVQDGGNKSGVPTVYGITFFDDGYIAKPAIFVSAGGLIPQKIRDRRGTGEGQSLILGYKKEVKPSDLIVMAGGRVGLDGIHGATESSLEAGEWISASHVQIGDPFTQKKLQGFLIEARDAGLFKAITDNGAGGLSSSVGEMARFSNGFELRLDKVPLKYEGLDPWQILLSESQERMTLAVSPKKIDKFFDLAKRQGVEATVIGKFTNSGKFYSTYEGKTVAYLALDFVHEGVPQMELEGEWLTPEQRGLFEPKIKEISDQGLFLKEMLSRPNISGKEYIVRQFDHEVLGSSIIKHLIGKDSDVYSDAAVIKPLYKSDEGLAISAGINPKYGQIDTYWMAALAIDEAIRRLIAVGGNLKQIAFNDNFCWPSPLPSKENPDAKYKLAQLVRANQALHNFTLAFKTPCISGKDSMSMDGWVRDGEGKEHRISALPTLQISAVGKIKDVRKCITMDVKTPEDLVYILGMTKDELGGSEYYETRGEI
ncbi:phosphoribosylformylglycinamidine synthase, partial [Patescibacteria group bacterium]|nr:phosphoribosylformylglycinamidine synthase [Patescibacteria group bacterium]